MREALKGVLIFLFLASASAGALALIGARVPIVVKVALASVLVLVAGGLAYSSWVRPTGYLGSEAWYQLSPWRETILFVLMVAGMLSRVLAVAIEDRDKALHRNRSARGTIAVDGWNLLYPLLFSAITFGGVLASVGDRILDWSTVILAYQNGFFWQTMLKSKSN